MIIIDLIEEGARLRARGDDPGDLRTLVEIIDGDGLVARQIAQHALATGETLSDIAHVLGCVKRNTKEKPQQ